jgi:hypothetical protein
MDGQKVEADLKRLLGLLDRRKRSNVVSLDAGLRFQAAQHALRKKRAARPIAANRPQGSGPVLKEGEAGPGWNE